VTTAGATTLTISEYESTRPRLTLPPCAATQAATASAAARAAGYAVTGACPSPILGAEGNREFFLHLTRTGRTVAELDTLIARAAESAEPA